MITFNTPKLAKNNTSETLDFSSTNIQADKEIDLLLTEPSPTVVTPDAGYLGVAKVTINHPPVEELTEAEITQNGEFHITPSEGYDATLGVTVNVQVGSSSEYSDVDGMCYAYSTITEFPTGWKFAPRTDNNCHKMFSCCNKLDAVPLFDTSSVTDMGSMFYDCSLLITVPLFDTSNVTTMNSMFYDCPNLTNISLFNTSNVTDMKFMFYKCPKLSEVPLFDTSKLVETTNMFYKCNSLTALGGFTGLKVNLNLTEAPNLTKESLLNVINEAADVTASPKTLTFGSTNLAKLTDEEKAIATNKGWTLV